jgi:hypothetical protein
MAKHTIALKGHFIRKEGKASSAITPGHLVEFGGTADLRVHSTIGGQARKAFALENDLIGKGITDAYVAGDTVQYGVFPPGTEVYAILGAGLTCAKGDFLESNGNGTLKATSTAIEGSNIGVAMEAQTTAGGRVRIEVV